MSGHMPNVARPEKGEFEEFFLWSGFHDLQHLEDVTDLDGALAMLQTQCTINDWTLWHRKGFKARLAAVMVRGQVLRFDHNLIDRVT